ncbi:MAG: hypothetical protein HRU82_02525 [Nitrospira sp.]|nr:MAG: hypothetical protein HRU82_02525 [Nitrospira sp.]
MMLALLLVLLFPALSHASANWPNEPNGATQLLDCNFSSTPGACGILDVYSSSIQATDGTAPISASGVVKSAIYAGNSSGGMQLNWLTNGQTLYTELFVGLMWRTNPEFEGRTVGNKMFFIRGPGSNGVFLFGGSALVAGSAPMIFAHNSGTLDNSHACALDLGLVCYPNVGSGSLTRGTWTKLEAYIKKSTTCTSRDGIVRWWINGVPAGAYTNLNYGCQGLNEWVWSETWDGTVNPVPTVEWAHFIDHLHVSTGPASQPIDTPAGAPATPTGFVHAGP